MADCTGLENRRPFTGSVSSNLTLSATKQKREPIKTGSLFCFGVGWFDPPAPSFALAYASRENTHVFFRACVSPSPPFNDSRKAVESSKEMVLASATARESPQA